MKTKIKNLFIALAWLALPAVVQAQNAYSTNADGSIYTYSTNADGSANIVAYAGPPWVVTIPTHINGLTVASIGEEAFANTSLTSVTIGNSVTSIGEYAFYDCYRVTNVTIGNSVTSIGEDAFGYCFSLTSVTIPDSVTSIGDSAFEYCSGLTSVTIPDSVTSIGGDAFVYCSGLTSVTIGSSVTNIDAFAFNECSGLTNIAVSASNPDYSSTNGVLFDKDQATLIEYPMGLTNSSYTIPNSVTSIGDLAFLRCSGLTSVTIGNSVSSIGNFAFAYCTSLTSVTIGNSVTSIGEDAFASCSGLTSVTIPDSVTNIGIYAFELCTSLTNVTIPNSVTSIGEGTFEDCTSLTSVTIGNSVTSIGDQAFAGCGLTSVTIPNSVTSIGGGAFEETGLTSVTIPNSVTSLGEYAFGYDYSLTSVYFTGHAPLPTNDSTVFQYDLATVYYLPGTSGWGAMFDYLRTAPWFLPNPLILNHGASFGVQPGGFGFTISWATNASVVVEAATNLANPVWIPVSANPLTNGTSYFSDPQWTNYPERFYRVTSAFTVGGTLTGLPAGDTVTLQDNGGDDLTLSNNGAFTFPTALPNGQAYSVTFSGITGDTSVSTAIDLPPVTANGSGTISGANVTNVAVHCTPLYTGNPDVDMYNAAVADGTANGGVPAVMLTENGGPFRVTTADGAPNSSDVCQIYYPWSRFIIVPPGTPSCSSTTLSGPAIQFGGALVCGAQDFYGY